MVTLTFAPVLPANTRLSVFELNGPLFVSRRKPKKMNQAVVPVARLFGPAIFEASKLKVLFLGVDEKKHPGKLPRAYTLTHSDITAKLTLAISQTINNSQLQGWANRIYRDEVVAEWKKVKGKMSLHVHCHISGGHFLLDLCARLRYFIFCKELPVVLKAFVHGDGNLLKNYQNCRSRWFGFIFTRTCRSSTGWNAGVRWWKRSTSSGGDGGCDGKRQEVLEASGNGLSGAEMSVIVAFRQ
ncbi:Protein STAY-GREEN [Hibiscus syriacus]|uniref:Protein STAY-GREEN n=1 Tax=Hibiscus syriacus TaxID=106335 RepID=A0A6A2XQM2_HIBSY|nr:magnesium dechelatase SGR1, chloroplastic-like [Hibiscus syriacus]KAE8678003.1 Protein STAY-GREEN [Hibiscus syriacus]